MEYRRYAVIDAVTNKVIGIVRIPPSVTEPPDAALLVESEEATIGDTYSIGTQRFTHQRDTDTTQS